jgi:hypothetical protein
MIAWLANIATSIASALQAHRKPKAKRSPRWPQLRAEHLRLEPYCQACGRANHLSVHHVEPVHVAPDKELDSNNLITLCEGPVFNCHLFFGHLGNWKSWNPTVRKDAWYWKTKVCTRLK